ncbi:50S ribosomal protein L44e [archaeon]|nr:50S ribosomal protein L44e [archaeon]
MEVPKEIRTYCPRCRKPTIHKVSLYKPGKTRKLAQGQRRFAALLKGYGSFPRPKQRKQAKTTKKQVLKLTCRECGYILHRRGIRLRELKIATR